MRVSWNWLSEWVDLSVLSGPKALGDLLTSRGFEVESMDSLDRGLEQVITAEILDFSPHPQADRLNVCRVSRKPGDELQIVCGAPNVKKGARVALAQIGALLPNGMKIVESKIRGVTSQGMLCSEKELGLSEESNGIILLPETTGLGLPFAQVLGRQDTCFTLKVTANRGDALSHLGVARELAAALGQTIKRPAAAELPQGKSPISVHLEAGELAPQFLGCWIEGIRVGPSPDWLVRRLEVLGSRSINTIVDAANLVLLETGQPMHTYDADRIAGKRLTVRMAVAGEELPLLDGQTIQLLGTELVIADAEKAVALAGVMGGGNSEVQDSTKTIFIECAEFDAVTVRKAAFKHQRRTDAAHRFEKGVDPAGLLPAMTRLARLITELAGGEIRGWTSEQLPSRTASSRREIRFGIHFVHDFLGFPRDSAHLAFSKMEQIFKSLECQVTRTETEWKVIPPSYRLDLNLKEDMAEEIARTVGYDLIPATVPPLSSSPVFAGSSRLALKLKDRAKECLIQNGLFETVNFAFTSSNWLSQLGFTSTTRILNPLSEEYEFLIPSLLPGLIKNSSDNWNRHFGSEPLAIRLFELRPVFSTQSGEAAQAQDSAKGLMSTPIQETWKLAFALSGPRFAGGMRQELGEIDFYDIKSILDSLWAVLGTKGVRYQTPGQSSYSHLYHPGQSAEIRIGNATAGCFGLLHPRYARDLKARSSLWIGELDWETIAKLSRKASEGAKFKTWGEFPSIERDFALVVKSDVTAEKLCQSALKAGKPIAQVAKIFDYYQGSQIAQGMTSVAVRVIFYDEHRSLQEAEAETASAKILESWKKEFGAELRN